MLPSVIDRLDADHSHGGSPFASSSGSRATLMAIRRASLASVGTLVLGLRCSWCPGSAPMPKLLGLYALPPARGFARGASGTGL